MFNIYKFYNAVLSQNALEIKKFFNEDAYIDWHNTNERFTVDEFIKVNCTYPGKWSGEVERVEQIGNLLIAVAKVINVFDKSSFYVNSFILLENGKISKLDEYWGDNGKIPQWRIIKNIGVKIK
ncbi:nuclear transport factor 2 family protein [Parvimonas micra]|uniref:nuclear transport factor 2 family protein n=1 Tax=Parvimonas micra TaxID=33033 RepID=UPI002B4A5593|nr:nuclear transport factor 2 family protein [Parvimonas micra]MEB3029626.1 nuclear transport factor 2 family protein [Parvimonas micra]